MTAFMDVEKAVDIVLLNFFKEFEFCPDSYNVITNWKYGLGLWTVRWIENCLTWRALMSDMVAPVVFNLSLMPVG